MGSARKNTKGRPQPQLRSRITRSSKGRLLDSASPALSGALLDDQLRALGLYAANTVGDGNCLFRALSDQLYGSPSRHFELRGQICDWIGRHRERYEPFVEDDRGLETHLKCMREHGTYGGHMELSAFAHLTQRNVKVIQPGLVYVIEWTAFASPSSSSYSLIEDDEYLEDGGDQYEYEPPPVAHIKASDRERRHRERAKEKEKNKHKAKTTYAKKASFKRETSPVDESEHDEEGVADTIYVAYHDWEHFSSIRNLRGPHVGLPCVQETPPPSSGSNSPAPAAKKVSAIKDTEKKSKVTLKAEEVDPTTVPLPNSRSASPFPSTSNGKAGTSGPHPLRESFLPTQASTSSLSVPAPHSSSSTSTSALLSTFSPSPSPYSSSSGYSSSSRSKRAHNESSGECEEGSDVGSSTKRSRRSSPAGAVAAVSMTRGGVEEEEKMDVDGGEGMPALSSGVSTASSSDVASSPEPEPELEQEVVPVRSVRGRRAGARERGRGERPMTRRERKRLGLPKPTRMLGRDEGGSVGRIVIPGGRFSRGVEVKVEGEVDGDEEWRKNGSGRLDVRGFRELKI